MRIIHLVRAVTWGGGERYALDLCRKSVEARHDVIVATRGVALIDDKFKEAGTSVKKMPLGGIADFMSPLRLAQLAKERKGEPLVIHTHTFKDAELVARAKHLLGKDNNIRLVCTRHLVKRGKKSLRWKFIYANIDSLIFVSDLSKDAFLSTNPPIAKDKITVVPNSVIIPQEYREVAPSSLSYSPLDHTSRPLKLLFTGRISPEKGIETLFEALTLLSDIPLLLQIAGTGQPEYIAQLQQLAADSHISDHIDWLGFKTDIYREIAKADICVAPSVAVESFGLTIIEFMSQGKPLITTSNGAQKEIVTAGVDGLLVPPGDAQALADAIRLLSENGELRKKMGETARHTFYSRFSYNIFFNRILEIYK